MVVERFYLLFACCDSPVDIFLQDGETHFWWTSPPATVVLSSERMNQVNLDWEKTKTKTTTKTKTKWGISVNYKIFLFRFLVGWRWPQAFKRLHHTWIQVALSNSFKGHWTLINSRWHFSIVLVVPLNTIWHYENTKRQQKSGGIFLFTPENPQSAEVIFMIYQIYDILIFSNNPQTTKKNSRYQSRSHISNNPQTMEKIFSISISISYSPPILQPEFSGYLVTSYSQFSVLDQVWKTSHQSSGECSGEEQMWNLVLGITFVKCFFL